MPLFVAALLGGLIQAAGSLVGRVLISLGVGFVVYQGVDVALATFKTEVFSHLAVGAAYVPRLQAFAGVFQVGTCFNILFSGLSAKLVLSGLTGGTFKRMIYK